MKKVKGNNNNNNGNLTLSPCSLRWTCPSWTFNISVVETRGVFEYQKHVANSVDTDDKTDISLLIRVFTFGIYRAERVNIMKKRFLFAFRKELAIIFEKI